MAGRPQAGRQHAPASIASVLFLIASPLLSSLTWLEEYYKRCNTSSRQPQITRRLKVIPPTDSARIWLRGWKGLRACLCNLVQLDSLSECSRAPGLGCYTQVPSGCVDPA